MRDVVHTKVNKNHESDPGSSSTGAFNSAKAGDSGCEDKLNGMTVLSIEMMDIIQVTYHAFVLNGAEIM